MEGHKFQRVLNFRHLGSKTLRGNDIRMAVNARIQIGDRCFYGQGNMFGSIEIT